MANEKPNDPRVIRMRTASASRVAAVKNKISMHFNLEAKHCVCGSLSALIVALKLSEADRSELINEIQRQGLKVPR